MNKRKLGSQGLQVSALGLGCMGMSFAYGKTDESDCICTLHRSLELGINFWDTAQTYGPFTNEQLLGKALAGTQRDKVIIATKFAWKFAADGTRLDFDGSPANSRAMLEGSLKRLGTDYVDLYYQHRLGPDTPIEETVAGLAALVKEGKVRYIGLSEVGPSTIRKAHAVHPLSAVQSEYSLWETGPEEKVIPCLRELGIGLVAYSPVGRGFLTGQIKSIDDLGKDDWRRNAPRFQGENFRENLKLVEAVKKIAVARNMTPAQVALAWLLGCGTDIVPIPGTTKIKHLEENAKAADITLSQQHWTQLESILSKFKVAGTRYPSEMMKMIGTD